MNQWQKDVLEFHKKFECLINNKPTGLLQYFWKQRLKLIKEEYKELKYATEINDMVEVADALADLLYVTLGTAVSCGIDLEPIWDEVHKTNMAKEGGGKNVDGKVI